MEVVSMERKFKSDDGSRLYLYAVIAMQVVSFVASIILMIGNLIGGAVYDVLQSIILVCLQAAFILSYFLYKKKRNMKTPFAPSRKLTPTCVLLCLLCAVICFVGYYCLACWGQLGLEAIGYNGGSSVLDSDGVGMQIFLVFLSVFVAPLGEELINRDALLGSFVKRHSVAVAVLLSGAVFALMHTNPEQTVYQFCLGCVAAAVTLATRNVVSGMIVHSASNAIVCIFSMIKPLTNIIDGWLERVFGNVWLAVGVTLILAMAATVLIVIIAGIIARKDRQAYPEKYETVPEQIPVCFDEKTGEPIFADSDKVFEIAEADRYKLDGYDRITGVPRYVDRIARQKMLRASYEREHGDGEGSRHQRAYVRLLAIVIGIFVFCWLSQFVVGMISSSLM